MFCLDFFLRDYVIFYLLLRLLLAATWYDSTALRRRSQSTRPQVHWLFLARRATEGERGRVREGEREREREGSLG